jgi:hypothetical protein
MVIADNWEFARSHATGDLIIMLSDDDALVRTTLEYYDAAARRFGANFLFTGTAEYRTPDFPGVRRNTLDIPEFSGSVRAVSVEEFVRPVFDCALLYDLHPSSYAFGRTLANEIASRCGRYFQTNGVEYCAWPMSAVFASAIAFIDLPLTICGRTKKSWGSNLILANPGKKRIQEMIADVEQTRRHAPLKNFTMANLRGEGVLTAKALFPREFRDFEFDEAKYMWDTWVELKERDALGVDVSRELEDVLSHLRKYPDVLRRIEATERERRAMPLQQRLSRWVGDRGLRDLRDSLRDRREAKRRIREGKVREGLRLAGSSFGFRTIVESAATLGRLIESSMIPPSGLELTERANGQPVSTPKGSGRGRSRPLPSGPPPVPR